MDPNSPAAARPALRSFYKIVLPSIINDHKLRIPEDFAKVYENELSSSATLIVPNGRAFCIKLEKAEKMLWFHKGWREFAEHHSIRCGFLLLFDYEGNSNFKVHIFDLTATEIEYPKTLITDEASKNGNKSRVLGKRGRKKTSPISSQVVIFNECSHWGVNRNRCLHSVLPILFQFAPEFAMRINKYGKCIMKSSLNRLRCNSQYQTRNKRRKLGDLGEGTSKAIAVFNSPIDSISEELFPENHENLFENSKFQNGNRSGHKKGEQFVEDFEDTHLTTPINIDDRHVKVKQEEGELIGVSDSSIFPMTSIIQGKENAFNAALMLKLKNPYFMTILKKQNVDLSYILNVPVYFGNKYLSSETHYLKLEGPDGKHLEVSCFSNGKVQYLSRGWLTFVKKYKLVEGDVCIFELIQVNDEVLKVHIFRRHQTSL